MISKEIKERFFKDTDETGRFIVVSSKTGIKYYVEPIDTNERNDWGDLDPVDKKFKGNYGLKYKGSIKANESLITEENGFENIVELGVGESPLEYINRIDKEREMNLQN